jgi:hypothetical protein
MASRLGEGEGEGIAGFAVVMITYGSLEGNSWQSGWVLHSRILYSVPAYNNSVFPWSC